MAGGRPSEYNPDTHPAIAESLARKGFTNTEIAEGIGIATSTLHEWRGKHPEFSDAVKRGKQVADDLVEKSLYQRAVGEDVTEIKTIKLPGGGTRTETLKKRVADTTAMIFWLKNRKRDKWRDRHDNSVDLTAGGFGDFEIVVGAPDEKADD